MKLRVERDDPWIGPMLPSGQAATRRSSAFLVAVLVFASMFSGYLLGWHRGRKMLVEDLKQHILERERK